MPATSPASLRYEVLKTYLGYEIISPLDEHMGELWNFAIDETAGELAYAIFRYDEMYYAFLWDEFHLCDENTLQLMMTPDLLSELPGIDPENCPPWRGHRVRLLEDSVMD